MAQQRTDKPDKPGHFKRDEGESTDQISDETSGLKDVAVELAGCRFRHWGFSLCPLPQSTSPEYLSVRFCQVLIFSITMASKKKPRFTVTRSVTRCAGVGFLLEALNVTASPRRRFSLVGRGIGVLIWPADGSLQSTVLL
jgi:hypothetical protein